jgi:hypothetical protein
VIEREGALDIARALRIAGQICRALAAAHQQGIVHRDLKPENVFLITRDGAADVVKVLDFGIAKTTEAEAARERRLTSPGMAMGTPEYMAPEQAAGRPADARCDVYALGAIMYEMVTGVPPYSGDNFMEILTKKATVDPPAPVLVRSELPLQVSDVVMSSMARSPDGRPQTMEALEYELNKCLAGRGVAVAQILGMSTDANLVMNLNPGLSVRNLDSEGTVARNQSQVAMLPRAGTNQELWETRSGISMNMAMLSGPASMTTTGQHAVPPRVASEPATSASSGQLMRAASPGVRVQSAPTMMPSEPSISLAPKRGALGVFGWLLLAAVLFGGVGALLYVALGERGSNPKTENLGTKVEQPPAPQDTPPPPVKQPDQGSDNTPKPNSATIKDTTHKPPQPPPRNNQVDKTVKRPVAVANPDDPKALLKQGKALEKQGEWEQARGVYQKLERLKGYAPEALYLQANAALGGKQTDDALMLAKKAAEQSTGQRKIDAQFLYGEVLYRQNEFSRAKDIFLGLRKRLTGEQKINATKRVAWCNKALHLPDNDGVTD